MASLSSSVPSFEQEKVDVKEGLTDGQVAKIAKHLKLAENGPSFHAVSRYLLCYPCVLNDQARARARARAMGSVLWATGYVLRVVCAALGFPVSSATP